MFKLKEKYSEVDVVPKKITGEFSYGQKMFLDSCISGINDFCFDTPQEVIRDWAKGYALLRHHQLEYLRNGGNNGSHREFVAQYSWVAAREDALSGNWYTLRAFIRKDASSLKDTECYESNHDYKVYYLTLLYISEFII